MQTRQAAAAQHAVRFSRERSLERRGFHPVFQHFQSRVIGCKRTTKNKTGLYKFQLEKSLKID
jgi:hypothetical protein